MFRHVLHNNNAGGIPRHVFEENPQRLGAACGSPDHNDFFRCLNHGAGRSFGDYGIRAQFGLNFLRPRQTPGTRHGSRFDGVADADSRFFQKIFSADFRLLDNFERAVFQGFERRIRAFLRQTGTYYHRNGTLRHDFLQERNPVHPRHFHIEGDDIRNLVFNPFCGNKRIGGCSHDSKLRVGFDDVAECLAHQRRIVHNQHPNLSVCFHDGVSFR